MSTMTTRITAQAVPALCLALASFAVAAQTAAPQTAAPPTHPAARAPDTSSTGPTVPPTHPATAAGGAGTKESQPAEDARRAATRAASQPAPDAATGTRNPTSTDSMVRDNQPKHPAAPAK